MNEGGSSKRSLSELVRERRTELSRPHPADLEAARLRGEVSQLLRELDGTEIALKNARRGAKRRGVQALARQKATRAAIGRKYAASRRRRKQASAISLLISQRDQALKKAEQWRWISWQQRENPKFGLQALGVSLDAARERTEQAEAEIERLRALLRVARERAEEDQEEVLASRGRLREARHQIDQLQSGLKSATEYAQGAEQWMIAVEADLRKLLPNLGPPPRLPRPPASG